MKKHRKVWFNLFFTLEKYLQSVVLWQHKEQSQSDSLLFVPNYIICKTDFCRRTKNVRKSTEFWEKTNFLIRIRAWYGTLTVDADCVLSASWVTCRLTVFVTAHPCLITMPLVSSLVPYVPQAVETSNPSWTVPCRTSATNTSCWKRLRSRRWGRPSSKTARGSAPLWRCCGLS